MPVFSKKHVATIVLRTQLRNNFLFTQVDSVINNCVCVFIFVRPGSGPHGTGVPHGGGVLVPPPVALGPGVDREVGTTVSVGEGGVP